MILRVIFNSQTQTVKIYTMWNEYIFFEIKQYVFAFK